MVNGGSTCSWQPRFSRMGGRHQLDDEAGLLLDLPEHRLDGVLVVLYVAAGREPRAHLAVPVEGDAVVVYYEGGGGEVAE